MERLLHSDHVCQRDAANGDLTGATTALQQGNPLIRGVTAAIQAITPQG